MSLLKRDKRVAVPGKSSDASSSITDISWGNTLVVSPLGSASGEREKLKNHFSTLEAAMTAAQSNDSILIFGDYEVEAQITVDDGREIAIHVMGGVLSSSADITGVLFQVRSSSVVKMTGHAVGKVSFSHTGGIAQATTSAFFSLSSFVDVQGHSLVSVNDATAIIQDIGSMELSGSGNGTCALYNVNGEITLQRVGAFSSSSDNMCCNLNGGVTKLYGVRNGSVPNGRIGLVNPGTGNELEIEDCDLEGNAGTSTSGAIQFVTEGKLKIKNSTIAATNGYAIIMLGELNIDGSTVSTDAAMIISYTQSNAGSNQIVNSKLIGDASTAGIAFTGSSSTSDKLFIHSVVSNTSLPTDSQITSGFNIENVEISS